MLTTAERDYRLVQGTTNQPSGFISPRQPSFIEAVCYMLNLAWLATIDGIAPVIPYKVLERAC